MEKENETVTPTYRYTSGSGRQFEHRAKYAIGSKKPVGTASVRDITPR
jgi:hypothetical protein